MSNTTTSKQRHGVVTPSNGYFFYPVTEEQRRKKAEEELWIKNNPHTSVADMLYPSMRKSTRRYNEHKKLEESIVRNQQEYNLANFTASELLYPSMKKTSSTENSSKLQAIHHPTTESLQKLNESKNSNKNTQTF